ncbi:Glutathione S-transferase domain protein [Methylocella silvestris BL2]|uniref:Glutathione S-transferase domain protein n=1 Tax=Methylocella silvestris (strain DSM 15510 / CIP 108128 / LMG 27833 / NCIMB 13906 / BL2) TaxID=395965 RepID=B8EIV3_METSB|nr:glutathione S-transferase [Methylocella silvestris]ACK52445.1 Glutathione S-transferase domain protein [Methylocella silvestris BL2]
MLVVWGRRNSLNVQKVLWLIGELGLSYENIPAGGPFGRMHDPRFLALTPHGRVPVLEDGDLGAWESHAILRYVAAQYGQGRFWDEKPAVRSRIDGWMDWSQSALQPEFLNGVFYGFYRTPEAQRDWSAIEKSLARCAGYWKILDDILATRPYLAGDNLSLADIPAGALLYRYFELEIERPSLPNVEAWRHRLQQRPAYREHVMVPFDEMRGRLDY